MDALNIVVIGDSTYSVGKMDAMRQFHVTRRLAPLLTRLVPILSIIRAVAPPENATPSPMPAQVPQGLLAVPMDKLAALAEAFAELPDETMDYIVGACLSVVQRKMIGDTGWVPIWNKIANSPQFADLELPVMLQLVGAVVWHNMQGFIAAATTLGMPGAATTSPKA